MLPVDEAQYVVLLTAGGFGDEYFIRWKLPLTRGESYIHGLRVKAGEAMIWLAETQREDDAWEAEVRDRLRARRRASCRD